MRNARGPPGYEELDRDAGIGSAFAVLSRVMVGFMLTAQPSADLVGQRRVL